MSTIEWFGATTYRLRTCGLTIFLDSWLERPSCLDRYLRIEDVSEADYIFISHAHFDHLAGADRLAKRTNATIIGNGEAINVMRRAGVPEENMMPVSGGERIPLFTRSVREKARQGSAPLAPGPPAAPKLPHSSLAALTVHVWPSLHALMPTMDHAEIPETMDSGKAYLGSSSHLCTLDITRGMTYGLLGLAHLESAKIAGLDSDMQSFIHWIKDADKNQFSGFDGGQLMYHFLIAPKKSLLVNSHLGGYEGVFQLLAERPTVAILGMAGRANLNGRPFDGSAADFALKETKWMSEPDRIIWCLHDRGPLNPKFMDTAAVDALIEEKTKSKVWNLKPTETYPLFENRG